MRIVITSLIAFLIGTNTWAEPPLTIAEAVSEALANNPQIHEKAAYREAAEFDESAARADYLPSLSAAYSYQNLAEAPYVNMVGNRIVTNSRDQHHWELTLSQPIFAGFAISARHRMAKLGFSTKDLELEQTRRLIVLTVKQRCYDLLMAEKTRIMAQSSTAALAAHEADVQKFHENGLAPLNDLLKARVARAEALQRQHRAEADVRQARSALGLLMGRDLDRPVEIVDIRENPVPAPPTETLIDQALAARPEISILERAIEAKDQERRVAASDYYPRIELTGKYQQDGDDPGARNNDYSNQHNASVGVTARWTFFEFGKTRATAAKAKAQQRALEQTLASARDDIRLQVVQTRLDLDVAAQNVETTTTALDQAREHWRITNLLYRQQLTTSTEVLDARSYLDRAESAFHEAHYGHGAALARLDWAVGIP